ncbi:potassium channel family protein [uncultured Tolumonas sp.]|uniref:potassium channel family protein n=1 Tax=uncultured Tolumonas sp. TaxID=263765 RepID=UPI00292D9958|nr:potassium channel family protein [uncultured Tolumonas sp.]
MQINITSKLWWLISPTYKYAEYSKNKLINRGTTQYFLSKALKKYNKNYFTFSILICLASQFLHTMMLRFICDETFTQYQTTFYYAYIIVVIFTSWVFLLSRAVEILKAFLDDAIDKLNHKNSNSNLLFGERLKLSLTSYIELIINFGTFYFLIPVSFFKDNHQFTSIIEAIYFSAVTITTIGYGDISPVNWFVQLITIFEVLTGFTLIVVCFTIYSSLALSNKPSIPTKKPSKTRKSAKFRKT